MKYRRFAFAASLLMFVVAGACAPGVKIDGLLNSNGSLSIVNVSLADGTIFASYDEMLVATGGAGTYTWSVISGGLPPGISLVQGTPIAQVTGTPNLTGSFDMTIRVRDSLGRTADQDLTLDVNKPVLSIEGTAAGTTFPEGTAGDATPMTFTVTLDPAIQQEVQVDYSTLDGSATASGLDYLATSGSLVFAPGVTERTLQVAILGDTVFENNGDDETFSVLLLNPVNAEVSGSGTGRITNDDDVELQVSDASVVEGSGGGVTELVFLVTLAEVTNANVIFEYSTADGTALDGSDYTGKNGQQVTIPAGSVVSSTLVKVQVTADDIVEVDETFDVTFEITSANAQFVGTADPLMKTVTATITTDSGTGAEVATIDIDSPSVSEGGAGVTTNMDFTVSLSNVESLPSNLTVDYLVADGTAEENDGGSDDYDFPGGSASGTVTFTPASIANQTISVPINGDAVAEANEDLTVTLSGPSSLGTLGVDVGTGTIDSDDAPGITVDDWSVLEGDSGTTTAQFTVSLTHYLTTGDSYRVEYTIADGTANENGADDDYDLPGGAVSFLVFNDGDPLSQTVDVVINGDLDVECDEDLTITLSDGGLLGGALILDATGVGMILRDDVDEFAFDFNGDCLPDIVVGANLADEDWMSNADSNEGKVYIFFGTGAATPTTFAAANADVIIDGELGQTDAKLGLYASGIPDINGDQIDEVVIGVPNYDNGADVDVGLLYIFLGGDSSLPAPGTTTLRIRAGDVSETYPQIRILGDAALDTFGEASGSAGDFNGDGLNDITVGASRNGSFGKAYIIYGSTTAFASASYPIFASIEGATGMADIVMNGETNNDRFGNTAAGIGDVNGDGFDDVLVGANLLNDSGINNAGRGYIFLGQATPPATYDAGTEADVVLTYDTTGGANANQIGQLGISASFVGDIGGTAGPDGVDDILITAHQQDDTANPPFPPGATTHKRNGACHVLFGDVAWVAGDAMQDVIAMTPASTACKILHTVGSTGGDQARFGGSCTGIGDFDGDGVNDFAVSAHNLNAGGTKRGAVYIFRGGSAATLAGYSDESDAWVTLYGSQDEDSLGQAVTSLGDLNGDGLKDLIVGAPSDLDPTGPLVHEGKCYVIYGGTASNTGGAAYDADSDADIVLTGENDGDAFSRCREGH